MLKNVPKIIYVMALPAKILLYVMAKKSIANIYILIGLISTENQHIQIEIVLFKKKKRIMDY